MNENLELLRDPKFYLENFCSIKGKTPGLIPFRLNEAQKDFYNAIRKHNRVIILKARQLGFSTGVSGFFYHDTIMTPGTTTALIGYNSALTSELLDKIKTFYRTTPDRLKPAIQYNSKFEISFPKVDSKILVLPSTENVGRGYTINNALCTELSAWDKAEEKMMVLEASVPINGRIVIESTPRGQGNLYHRMWMSDNDYLKKEYGWWWGYTREQIETIKKRMNNPQLFAQEYGLEFLASGRSVFDQAVLKRQRRNILKVGDKVKLADDKEHTVVEEDGLRIYRPPEKGHMYVFGADVSEGVQGGDNSCAVIFDRATGEEVAFFKGLLAPDRFGERLNKWGRQYNNAFGVVEVNNHGLVTITTLRSLIYPSLYFRPAKLEAIGVTTTDRIGWKTTKVTRPLLIDELAQALRDDTLIIHSKDIIDECSVFVYDDNGDMVPQESFHDDTIFASGIAVQGFKVMYSGTLTQLDERQHLPISYAY